MHGHNEAKSLKCDEEVCTKDFESKTALKKHTKEQHPTEKQRKEMQNINCNYCSKKFKTKQNKNEHELGCVVYPDREELTCEVDIIL